MHLYAEHRNGGPGLWSLSLLAFGRLYQESGGLDVEIKIGGSGMREGGL